MDSNKRQKKTEEDKAIRDLHYYFQSGPRKRKTDVEDNSQISSQKEEILRKKKFPTYSEEQEQIKSMISLNDKDLSSFIKNNKTTKVNMPEKEENILACFLYIKNNQKKIINNSNYNAVGITFKVELFSDSFFYIKIGNKDKYDESIGIEKNARIMNFIDEKQDIIYIHFIYNTKYLSKIMEELNFESYYTKPEDFKLEKEKKTSDSDESSSDSIISFENYATIFNIDSIKFIFKYNTKPIFSKENLDKKYAEKLEKLKDLSNTAKYYFKDINQKFYNFEEYMVMFFHIYKFACYLQTHVEYLFGPKFSSRSTFLIYSKNLFKVFKIFTLYLDVNCLKTKDSLERKRIISHELLYLFENTEEMEAIEKQKIFHGLPYNKENPLIYIYYFLKNLLKAIKKIKSGNTIVIIIDNIIDKDNDLSDIIQNIISLRNSNNIKFVLCGNGKYFNQKFIELFQNDSIQTNDYSNNAYILSINKKYKEKLDEFLKNSKKFSKLYENNHSKEEFEEKLIDNEKEYLDIYHFSGLFFGEELINKIIKKEDIKENKHIFFEMPFERY